MAKLTPLQAALERGLADGGDLFEALNELRNYEIETLEDAESLVDALEQYLDRPMEAPGIFTAFHNRTSCCSRSRFLLAMDRKKGWIDWYKPHITRFFGKAISGP